MRQMSHSATRAREVMLILEQQRRSRQAHRHELELALSNARTFDPRPLTLEERDQEAVEYAMVRVRRTA